MIKTVTKRVDDMDHRSVSRVREITFSIEGEAYAIDLAPRNVDLLRRRLAPFIESGRPISSQDMREWAKSHGYAPGRRGAISAEAKRAYAEAHAAEAS